MYNYCSLGVDCDHSPQDSFKFICMGDAVFGRSIRDTLRRHRVRRLYTPALLYSQLYPRSSLHCIFSSTHFDVNTASKSSRMTSCMSLASASIALYAAHRYTRPLMRRSKAHVQDALRRWINGASARLGEPLDTARGSLSSSAPPKPHRRLWAQLTADVTRLQRSQRFNA